MVVEQIRWLEDAEKCVKSVPLRQNQARMKKESGERKMFLLEGAVGQGLNQISQCLCKIRCASIKPQT